MEIDSNADEDWYVNGSDDEKYNPTKDKLLSWLPEPKDILNMFETMEKEKILELTWKCPGRRLPATDTEEDEADETQDPDEMDAESEKEEEKPPEKTAYDFDDSMSEVSAKITPRRMPGNAKTPLSTQKRVASLDKVLGDIRRQQIINNAEKQMRKGMTPKGRLTYGKQRPLNTAEGGTFPKAQTASPRTSAPSTPIQSNPGSSPRTSGPGTPVQNYSGTSPRTPGPGTPVQNYSGTSPRTSGPNTPIQNNPGSSPRLSGADAAVLANPVTSPQISGPGTPIQSNPVLTTEVSEKATPVRSEPATMPQVPDSETFTS